MTNYVIKLASNFQTIEFTLDVDEDESLVIENPKIAEAVDLINKLGEVVINTVKTKEPVKVTTEKKSTEMATEGQILFLKKFGIDGSKLTKKEAWKKLKELTNASEEE